MHPSDMSDDQLLEAFNEAMREGSAYIDEIVAQMHKRGLIATA